MGKRKRGGDKNRKSGKTWTREELKKVLLLYFKLNGKAIHEHNPQIVALGHELGRTTRSVEAQLIMFRSKDRSDSYGFKKMNHLIGELWNEFHAEKLNKNQVMAVENKLEELFNWFGHRKGGVKIAFTDRGNPTRSIIQTDLIDALDNWISNLGSLSNRFAIKVFFVGGPGNGKTEALDYAVTKIIKEFKLPYSIEKDIAFQAKESKRAVEVKVSNTNLPFDKIRLVQDASLGESNANAAKAMIDDYDWITDKTSLYICCINRGILQDVISLAKLEKRDKELELFSQLATHMDGTSELVENTWPISINVMGDSLTVAIWPMEISSLFESRNIGSVVASPFEQVLNLALENAGWQDLKDHYSRENLNSKYCPLLTNHCTFQNNKGSNIKSLINEYELLTNRRLTFREMLSLVVYLLLGHENDFMLDNTHNPIKVFTHYALSNLRDHVQEIVAYKSCFRLAMLQLEFKLFNSWPDLSPIVKDSAWKKLMDNHGKNGRMNACAAFIQIFTKSTDVINRTDLEKTLHRLNSLLDPSKLCENVTHNQEFNPSKIDLFLQDSVETLRNTFSLSYALSTIDKDVLTFFAQVEKELDEIRTINNVNSINTTVERLNFILKKITACYIKRKLGGYYGISSETSNIEKFKSFDGKGDNLRVVIDGLLGINYLSTVKGKPLGAINIAINSTFGQPDFSDQDVRFKSDIFYSVSIYRPNGPSALQPINDSRFLKLEISHVDGNMKSFYIPLTYHLYKAIMDIKSGLKQGTMPRDISATFDRMKSFMEGISVHGKEVDDSSLVFPMSNPIPISQILDVQK